MQDNEWPSGLFVEVLGQTSKSSPKDNYFTYLWGPGIGSIENRFASEGKTQSRTVDQKSIAFANGEQAY